VIAGVHIERAKDRDIRMLVYNSMKTVEGLFRKLKTKKFRSSGAVG